jgi:hypothetical protein
MARPDTLYGAAMKMRAQLLRTFAALNNLY